ncbi:coatomer subunit gamma [Pichia californica]|nr:coatomer subunit gamma [[Candida] californica]
MSTHTYKKNEDGDSSILPDKMTVYQECLQACNASPIQAKKCRKLLSRLLRLFYAGETFPTVESTNLFFSISKLFHNDDPALRQIAYLSIKELCSVSNDILMITASIMKDIQSGDAVYKPDAVRTLSRVLDGSTIHAAERLFKNCIVDSNQSISSAALVSSYHLLPVAKDVVKRWSNEVQESITANKTFPSSSYTKHEFNGYSKAPNTTYIHQYHALALIYQFRNSDKMSLIKMIQQLTERKTLTNSLAQVQMIRFVEKLILDDSNFVNSLWPLFVNWLNNKSDMVELEAAKLILNNSSKFNAEQQMHAITTLQSLLGVPRTVTRFAAVRILNKVAIKDAEMVGVCNLELERLISDQSRSISTYAITTLLKTGNAESVDRLVTAISNFMDEISDEFKIIVIDAIRTLSLKFPAKYKSMLTFLDDVLRDEGGFNFKNSIIEAIFDIIKFIPESKEIALEMLCEFIEDCEYTELSVRILHLLGNEGPKATNPSTYVRYIYNRVVLENSIVRSSAVIALSKFALIDDKEMNNSIKILLKRSLQDVDDEVRDRAVLSLKLLESKDLAEAKSYLSPQFKYSLPILEQELTKYVKNPDKASFKSSFNIDSIPKMSEEEYMAVQYKEKLIGAINDDITDSKSDNKGTDSSSNEDVKELDNISDITKYTLLQQQYQNELSALPEIGEYGALLHSSASVELTEKETEFVVSAIKHVFEKHIVIEYSIENTLEDILLENVNVVSTIDSEEYTEEFTLPIEKLSPLSKGKVYSSFIRPEDDSEKYLLTTFNNTLAYISKDADAEDDEEGFPDEYQIEDLSLTPGDFVIPSYISNFTNVWDELSNEESAVYNLGDEDSIDLQQVVSKLIVTMSMMPIEGTEVVISGKNHSLKLFGKSISGGKLAAIVKFASSSKGVMMKNVVKGEEPELVELVANYLE